METLAIWVRRLLARARITFVIALSLAVANAHATETPEPSSFEDWVFKSLVMTAPPEKLALVRFTESADQMRARYKLIARDMVDAISESPDLFGGPKAKFRTAALLISIGYFESGFHKAVADGTMRGDGGRSWCYMQINVGKGNVYVGTDEMKTWKGKDLVGEAGTKRCFLVGIETLRLSMNACKNRKGGDILSGYTSGTCRDNESKARARWRFTTTVMTRNPVPAKLVQLAFMLYTRAIWKVALDVPVQRLQPIFQPRVLFTKCLN